MLKKRRKHVRAHEGAPFGAQGPFGKNSLRSGRHTLRNLLFGRQVVNSMPFQVATPIATLKLTRRAPAPNTIAATPEMGVFLLAF